MSYEKATLKKIENLRHRLEESAFNKGFTNTETIAVSQQLDSLLNVYTNIKRKNR